MNYYDYRIALNNNVALVSLTNVETLIGQPPVSQTVDLFPVRDTVLSGRVIGGGRVDHEWQFLDALSLAQVEILEDTFFASGATTTAAVTIYTRIHAQGIYRRYNAFALLPQPEQDYTLDYDFAMNYTLRFTNLIFLP